MFFVYVVCCLTSCDKDCATCPTTRPDPDPTDRIIGVWTVFESYTNGSPDPTYVGMELDFRSNDTLFVFADTLEWFATEDWIIMSQESPTGGTSAVFNYYFEADTLDMSGDILGDAIRWRLFEE